MHAAHERLVHALVVARWEQLGRPVLVVARNERGQPYATVSDLAGFLRRPDPTPAGMLGRAAIVERLGGKER